MTERIQIVDQNDTPIGTATREEAWRDGLYHRLVRIIVEDEDGRLLSQKRSMAKKQYPGCWTDAASGHVDEGESYETAAARELEEEIGVVAPLEYIGKFSFAADSGDKHVRQFHGVFRAVISGNTSLRLNPDEVSDVKWFDRSELRQAIADHPEQFTPGVAEVISRYYA
jgi:isopentenyl-diphosphate delta-isomerase type 1